MCSGGEEIGYKANSKQVQSEVWREWWLEQTSKEPDFVRERCQICTPIINQCKICSTIQALPWKATKEKNAGLKKTFNSNNRIWKERDKTLAGTVAPERSRNNSNALEIQWNQSTNSRCGRESIFLSKAKIHLLSCETWTALLLVLHVESSHTTACLLLLIYLLTPQFLKRNEFLSINVQICNL